MPSNSNVKHKVGRAITWTAAAKFINQALALVTMVVVARLLAPKDIGLITLCLLYMQFLDNFVDAGILHAIIQFPELEDKTLNSSFWFLCILFLTAYVVTWFLSPSLATLFGESDLVDLLRVISILLFLMPLHIIGTGLLSRNLAMDLVGRIEVVAGLVRAIVSIVLVYLGFGVWSLVYGYIISRAMIAVYSFYKASWSPKLFYSHKHIRPIIDFGLKITASRLVWYFHNQIDTILVGKLLGTELLGIYSIGRQVVQQIWSVFVLFSNRIIYPLFSRYQEDRNRLNRIFLKITKVLSIIVFPVLLGISAKSEQIVVIAFGTQWSAGVEVLAAMAFIGGFKILSPQGPLAINAIGRPEINIWINIFQLIVLSLAFYVGAITNGLPGVAMAWLFAYPLVFAVTQLIAFRVLGLRVAEYASQVVGPILFGLIIYGVLTVTNISFDKMPVVWDLVISVGISAVLFYALLRLRYKDIATEVIDLVKQKKA